MPEQPTVEPFHDFDDGDPPYKKALEETREAERALERSASGGLTADEETGSDSICANRADDIDQRLVVGDVARVAFGSGKKAFEKTGTLLCVGGGVARVRLNGSKEPLGDVFPSSRVSTALINAGKPLKTKAEKKTAAEHALHMKQYEDAIGAGLKPSQPNGADHAAEDESAPLPKRLLKGHNGGVSEATIYRHLGAIRAKMEALESANGKLREAWKKAQDDGVDKKALRAIMSELKLSPEEIVETTNTLMAYRAAVMLPNAGPITLDEVPDAADAPKRQAYAREQGSLAGFRGAGGDCNPYPDHSDACHLAWQDGWSDAQAKLLMRGIAKA